MSAPDSFPALLKWILQKAYLPEIENPEMIYSPDKLSKSGGVVVPHRLGIAPSFKDGVGLDDLVLKGGLALLPLAGGADGGEVGDDLLRVLSLPGSRLASDEDRLRKDEVTNRSLSWWSWSVKLHCSSHQASKNTMNHNQLAHICVFVPKGNTPQKMRLEMIQI